MVNYVTQVKVKILVQTTLEVDSKGQVDALLIRRYSKALTARAERVADLVDRLEQKGFVIRTDGKSIIGESNEVEAQDIKTYLLGQGFLAQEFQVNLQYTRQWGML